MSKKATRETWLKRVERWKDSGMSARAFASELGISEPSLKWWKWKLAAEAAGAPIQKRSRVVEPEKPTVTFVEVPQAASRRASIEIVLPSRVRVRVRDEFDASVLERVLGVLEARR